MYADEIIDELGRLDDFGLSTEHYVVGFDAALVLHGIMESCDQIEVICSRDGIRQLHKCDCTLNDYDYLRQCACFHASTEIVIYPRKVLRRQFIQSERVDGYKVIRAKSMWRELYYYYHDDESAATAKLISDWLIERDGKMRY